MVEFRGVNLSQQTVDMLLEAERLAHTRFTLTQGSWSHADQSANTHAGSGAVDIHGSHQWRVLLALRQVGFAAWQRTRLQGKWNDHIHAIVLDDSKASPAAKSQMRDYRARLNGLANDRPDDGPQLSPIPTWASYQLKQEEQDDMAFTDEQVEQIKGALVEAGGKYGELYDLVVEIHGEVQYLREQNVSIAGAVYKLAQGSDDLTDEEKKAVADAASGKDRDVPRPTSPTTRKAK